MVASTHMTTNLLPAEIRELDANEIEAVADGATSRPHKEPEPGPTSAVGIVTGKTPIPSSRSRSKAS